jgi:hypothetical protein
MVHKTEYCCPVHSLPHPRHGAFSLSLSFSFLGGILGRRLTGALPAARPLQQRLRQYFVHVAVLFLFLFFIFYH